MSKHSPLLEKSKFHSSMFFPINCHDSIHTNEISDEQDARDTYTYTVKEKGAAGALGSAGGGGRGNLRTLSPAQ